MKLKDVAAVIASLAALTASVTGLVTALKAQSSVQAADKDRAYLWDDHGDQVAEVERLKERLAELEAKRNR